MVAWPDQRAGSYWDIYARRVAVDGGLPGADFLVSATPARAAQEQPAVAYSAAEAHYLVVWQEEGETSLYDIWGRFVPLPTGTLPDAFSIATTAAPEEAPAVVCGAVVGEWYVAWQSKADIQGSTLDTAGELLGDGDALTTAAQSQVGVALAYDSARSRYLAVWTDSRNDSVYPDVYAQLARGYNLVVNYTYDGLYRLAAAAYSDGATYGYAYDAVGNRTRYTNTTAPVTLTTYTYDDAERLASVLRAGVQVGYSWSDRGELLSDGVQSYDWDAAGRLTHVTGPANLDVSYTYNGANNRVGMTVNGAATAYVVDPFNSVESVSENAPLSQVLVETTGEEATRYFYGLDLLGHTQDSVATYYGYDAQNLRLHLDDSGEIAAQYRYGPFGEIVGDGPAGYGYTGEAWDSEVGLLYLRARYYRPEIGRFASRDLWSGVRQLPETLHRYAYAGNDPVRFADPSGYIYLTLDDGPGAYEQRILDVLKENNARATFFFIGEQINVQSPYNREIIWRVAAEGHRLGNHSYRHDIIPGMCWGDLLSTLLGTEQRIRASLQWTKAHEPYAYQSLSSAARDYIDGVIEHGTGLFRARGGNIQIAQVDALQCDSKGQSVKEWGCEGGLSEPWRVVGFNIVPEDTEFYKNPNIPDEEAVDIVVGRLKEGWRKDNAWGRYLGWLPGLLGTYWWRAGSPGIKSNNDIILLHSSYPETEATLKKILPWIKERNYTFDVIEPNWSK